jgi:hypothetical protein
METLIISIIGAIVAVGSFFLGILTYKRNYKKDLRKREEEIEQKAKQETADDVKAKIQMNAKLDAILSNNAKSESLVKELSNKFDSFKDDFGTRLAKVEERCEFLYKMIGKKK